MVFKEVRNPLSVAFIGLCLLWMSTLSQVLAQDAESSPVAAEGPSEGSLLEASESTEPKVSSLTEETLVQLIKNPRGEEWPFDAPGALSLLAKIEAANPSLKEQVTDLFEWKVIHSIRNNEIASAEKYYTQVLKRRPDPDKKNTDLRVAIISKARGEEAKYFAAGRMEELKYSGDLTSWMKFKLWYDEAKTKDIPRWPIVVFILFIGLLYILFYHPYIFGNAFEMLLEKLRGEQKVRSYKDGPVNESRVGKAMGLGTVVQGGYMQPVSDDDEYSRLLRIFGLDDSADESEIKAAYRRKMKESHPDSQPGFISAEEAGLEGYDPGEFIHLKAIYERILEIRGSWFGN